MSDRLLASIAWLVLTTAALAPLNPPSAAAQNRLPSQTAPHDGYWLCFAPLYEGDFREALVSFREAARSRIVTTAQTPWIDAICYHAMMGECHYQAGNLAEALEQYSAALKVYLANSHWMLRLDFSPEIAPDQNARPAITWGTSSRPAVLGRFPKTFSSLRGRLDNQTVLRTGGVVDPPSYQAVYAAEIVRCTALALSRRREILGPACQYDALTGQLANALARRPGPPNHWSQCWIELQLGLAYASSNRIPQAVSELQKSLLAGGQYDHPLTCLSLLELGRLTFEQGKYDAAITYFHESTISAAHFSRYDLMEEAFRLGAEAHLVSGKKGVYPPLAPATTSPAVKDSRTLQVSLLTSLAEHLGSAGETAAAATAIAQARGSLPRRAAPHSAITGRLNYQAARIALHAGDAKAASTALAAALAYQSAGSPRLFQIGYIDALYRSGGVTERVADLLFAEVLREPTPADWVVRPLDSLAVASSSQALPYEHWFELALTRKQPDHALEIAEQIRRHRFLASQPLGGRLIALRWILEGPPQSLSQAATLQRQELLVRFPKFAEFSRRAAELKSQLQTLPIAPSEDTQSKQQTELFTELANISAAQETLLQLIALERIPSELAFPPRRSIDQIRQELPEGTLAFYYFATSRNMHAFALTKERLGHYPVAQPSKLKGDVAEMLRLLGNLDPTQPVPADDLKANGWKPAAERLIKQLTNNQHQTDWTQYRELLIIPDGALWYLPFELLPVPIDDDTSPLLIQLPIRYAPTLATGLPSTSGAPPLARTAVVAGKLLPRDDDASVAAATEAITAVLPGSVAIRTEPRVPSAIFATAFDRLIVFKDHDDGDKLPYGWSPLGLDSRRPGSTLADWMQLPHGGVDQLLLPGFHTPADVALKRGGSGDELFLAACGLMASGCRTMLISRWRVGGQSTIDLMREFVQELPHEPAAVAWRRSVQLAANRLLDPALEGRLRSTSAAKTLTADHPFFWSGYMLIDTGLAPSKEPEDTQSEKKLKGVQ